MEWYWFIPSGMVAGFFAGLLGIGGGLMLVAMMLLLFPYSPLPEETHMPLALGTSLATIVLTGLSSGWSHFRLGNVHLKTLQTLIPGLLMGTFLGALLASHLPSFGLRLFFIGFMFFAAYRMVSGRKNTPENESFTTPNAKESFLAGNGIGCVSSWVGIGGGALTVPYLTWRNLPMHQAIGTAAAAGIPIALAGTLGYVLGGQGKALPYSWGYVYLPAWFGICCGSIPMAPVGASLVQRLPVRILRRIFAGLLLLLAIHMIGELLSS